MEQPTHWLGHGSATESPKLDDEEQASSPSSSAPMTLPPPPNHASFPSSERSRAMQQPSTGPSQSPFGAPAIQTRSSSCSFGRPPRHPTYSSSSLAAVGQPGVQPPAPIAPASTSGCSLTAEDAATAAAATEASMTVEAFERSPFETAAASTSALARRRNARLDRRDRESEHFDARRALDRFGNAVGRGAATGALLRGGLHAVSLALAAAAPARRRRRALAGAPGIAAASADAARYAAFLGAFAGIYVLLDEGIARGLGKRKTAAWRAAASGACAAPAVLLLGRKQRHTSLAIYLLLRGATLLVRVGNKPLPTLTEASAAAAALAPSSAAASKTNEKESARRTAAAETSLKRARLVRTLLAPTRWEHGDTFLMCLAASQITYSWIIKPHTLPTAFVRFLNKHGGHDLWFYDAARELASRPAGVTGPVNALIGTPHEGLVGNHPCDWAHPGTTCDGNAAAFFPAALARALPVYLPVYLVPALLVHGRKLLPGPDNPGAKVLWKKLATGCLRSSAFLALYCTLCWRGACVGFQLTGRLGPSTIPGFAWMGGLATLVEKKSRRMELAIYCLSRAAESFALCLPEWGLVPKRRSSLVAASSSKPKAPLGPRYDLVMLCAASAAICHCYSDSKGAHRDVFRSKYLSVLDFILGSDGVERGSIRHSPSASDLVARAVAASPSLPALPTVSSLQAALPSLPASMSMPQLPQAPAMLQPAAAAAASLAASLAASQAAAAAAGCAGAIASGAAAGAGALAVAAGPAAAALAIRARSFLDLLSSEEYEGADSPRADGGGSGDGEGEEVGVEEVEKEVFEVETTTLNGESDASTVTTTTTSLHFHRTSRSSPHPPTIEEEPGVVASAAEGEDDGGGGGEEVEEVEEEGEELEGEEIDDRATELATTPRRSTKPLRFRKSRHNWEALLSCDTDDERGSSAGPSPVGGGAASAASASASGAAGLASTSANATAVEEAAAVVRSRNPVIPDSLLEAMSLPVPAFVRSSQRSVSAVSASAGAAAADAVVAVATTANETEAAKQGSPSSPVSPRLDVRAGVRAANFKKRMSSFGGDEALAP